MVFYVGKVLLITVENGTYLLVIFDPMPSNEMLKVDLYVLQEEGRGIGKAH